ncbi:TetR/AcrR family transcriptional regulator C-terminal domain-containing protein [Amycolatopsis sp. cg13]|uniref:TetR/AcrR family transcriptional regulator C-terminal domain-containing protein n=1 Tax=Amycolatopsis sp. cg13 TaxID=3238807 RepID=UPI00352425CE
MTQPAAAPPEGRSAAKYTAILRGATEVFLREGYVRASVDAIAAAAGVGKQTVYGHFGNKERLFLAVVERVRAEAAGPGVWSNLIVDTGNPRADLEATGERLLRILLAPEVAALHRLTVAELTHLPDLQRLWRDSDSTQTAIGLIADYLRERDRAGDLLVPDPVLSAHQFSNLLGIEGRTRSMYGAQPITAAERATIAREVADLIVRAHRRV